jgi:uncharacterized protein with HEPN domain
VKEPRECRDYLADILQGVQQVSGFIKGMDFQHFSEDQKTVYAVIYAIEIVGEAARAISPELRKKYSQIPWRDMAGMRDKLIHDYHQVNLRVVWQTATEDLPSVAPKIRKMLDELGG